jgi:hypothetical protein
MIILVTGDREWDNVERVYDVLSKYPHGTTLVHGYARGADSCAHVVGEALGFSLIPCPAHWKHNEAKWIEVYGPCDASCDHVEGKSAGTLRNHYMLRTHRPNRVLAFHDNLSGSRGTLHMVTISLKAGIPVEHYSTQGLVCVY